MLKKYKQSNSGFTLIELLIVIVIIGILAAVVIGVLNPTQQQARARDGAARSLLSKMALSTKSLAVSSTRLNPEEQPPTLAEFQGGIGNIDTTEECLTGTAADSDAVGERSCDFMVNGVALAPNCDGNTYSGTGGTTDCQFVYWKCGGTGCTNGTGGDFKLGVRGAASPEQFFIYHYDFDPTTQNVEEGFYQCTEGAAAFNIGTLVPATNAACTRLE